MVFKRRDRRPIWQVVRSVLWPRGGWGRAFEYVKHRVRRLPDTPERISRGIWAGVFTAFTPFYGLHFVFAACLARLMRGNILASLMATFIGNPLTYVPIAVAALQSGYFVLGRPPKGQIEKTIGAKFGDAGSDLWHNFLALFTSREMDWHGLSLFYDEVFLPYLVGGLLPGVIVATVCYYLSLPVIAAYQNRRRKLLRNKLNQLGKNTQSTDGSGAPKG